MLIIVLRRFTEPLLSRLRIPPAAELAELKATVTFVRLTVPLKFSMPPPLAVALPLFAARLPLIVEFVASNVPENTATPPPCPRVEFLLIVVFLTVTLHPLPTRIPPPPMPLPSINPVLPLMVESVYSRCAAVEM